MGKRKENGVPGIVKLIIIIVILIYGKSIITSFFNNLNGYGDDSRGNHYTDKVFYLISSSENEVLDADIKKFAKKECFKIEIEYEDTLKIVRRLNSGERYDAVWLSNSIWMYALDTSKVYVSDTKSTSINPIVFGIRKSKAGISLFLTPLKKCFISDSE